jgi:Dna[CI] antecedent, DciA
MTWKRWSPVDDPGDIRPVGDSLGAVARHLGLGSSELVVSVFGEWETVVGPVLASHSRPERLRDGELVVSVDEPAWATELRFLSGDIADRINKARGSVVISTVSVVVQRPGGKEGSKDGGETGGQGSRTARWARAAEASRAADSGAKGSRESRRRGRS